MPKRFAPRVLSAERPSPIPAACAQGSWQSGVALDPPDRILFSWVEGTASHRLGRWDLGSGGLEVTKTIGALRDVVVRDTLLHVLTSNGLETLDRTTLKKVGELRKQLPRDPSRLRVAGGAVEGDLAIVGGYRCASSSLVSLATHEFVAKLRFHAPDVVLPARAGTICVGTVPEKSNGAVIDGAGQTIERVRIPKVADAILHEGRVLAFEDAADGTPIFAFRPGRAPTPIATLPEEDIVFRLLGVDPGGHLVVELEDDLVWVSLATGAVTGRVATKRSHRPPGDNPVGALLLVGPRVVVPPDEPRSPFWFHELRGEG